MIHFIVFILLQFGSDLLNSV